MKNKAMATNDELISQRFYHGTKADLKPGDLIVPGYYSNYGKRKKAVYVYLSATLDAAVVFEQLMEQGQLKRQWGGRPRLRPVRVVNDKGYSSGKIRRYLRRRGIGYTIARKENELHQGKFDKPLYRQRNQVVRVSDAKHNGVSTGSSNIVG